MSQKRIVKSYEDITVTEVTLSDGQKVISRAYSVRVAGDPTALKQFGDLGAADTYYEELILKRQP